MKKSRLLLEDQVKEKYPDKHMKQRPPTSCTFTHRKICKCCGKIVEFAFGACMLCICCPLSLLWCCVKLPCMVGWRVAKRLTRSACCGCDKIFATYSSFSDIDSDSLPCRSHTNCVKELDAQRK